MNFLIRNIAMLTSAVIDAVRNTFNFDGRTSARGLAFFFLRFESPSVRYEHFWIALRQAMPFCKPPCDRCGSLIRSAQPIAFPLRSRRYRLG
jgi:hypothetical protein